MLIESSFLWKLAFKRLPYILLVIVLFGCEPHGVISVDEKVPPSFNFTGSGTVPFFVVVDLGDEGGDGDNSEKLNEAVLWKITPNSTKAGTIPLGPITYGIVPTGWSQTVPDRGSPPPLVEGRVYHAGGPGIEMPEGVVKFRIASGKVVRN